MIAEGLPNCTVTFVTAGYKTTVFELAWVKVNKDRHSMTTTTQRKAGRPNSKNHDTVHLNFEEPLAETDGKFVGVLWG